MSCRFFLTGSVYGNITTDRQDVVPVSFKDINAQSLVSLKSDPNIRSWAF